MIQNSNLELQVRTAPQGGYSSITNAALKYLGETAEIRDNNTKVGLLNLTSTAGTYGETIYELSMPLGQFVRIAHWSYGLSVQVQGNGAYFAGSKGMCGSWNSGGVKDRNDNDFPVPTNTTKWALEWQVANVAESLFQTHNNTCTGPENCGSKFPEDPDDQFPCKDRNAAADPGRMLEEFDCDKTCNDIDDAYPELKLNCVYDVTVTGKSSFACNPSYTSPVIIRQPPPLCYEDPGAQCFSDDHKCESIGGRCRTDCKDDDSVCCFPDLCTERPKMTSNRKKKLGMKDKCVCAVPRIFKPVKTDIAERVVDQAGPDIFVKSP